MAKDEKDLEGDDDARQPALKSAAAEAKGLLSRLPGGYQQCR